MIIVPLMEVELPCCPVCHDWMFPAMLFVHPFDGVVWICLEGHRTLIHGVGDPDSQPDWAASMAISLIAHEKIGGRREQDGLG